MKVAVFSAKNYDREFLGAANAGRHELVFLEPRLTAATAPLADGFAAVCAFVHDEIDAAAVDRLASGGCRFIALRCAGYNQVDLGAAARAGVTVARVPAYSPHGVAEHAVALLLALNRKTHRAYNRVREGNFSLEGLVGFDVHGKTVGVVGAGKIGAAFARIMLGFGCEVLAFDTVESAELRAAGVRYVALAELFGRADIVSLHCPLVPATHHLIRAETLAGMKRGVVILNTSRGALIDTRAAIDAIKAGVIGALGLDVYEEEEGIFFEDLSTQIVADDELMRLMTFPNVLITSHQAFFTREALRAIAETTVSNLTQFEETGACDHALPAG
jgi:D-lactate dehydrogenase